MVAVPAINGPKRGRQDRPNGRQFNQDDSCPVKGCTKAKQPSVTRRLRGFPCTNRIGRRSGR